ncbi:hypothetical protein [Nisaea sediminum]|uniref:hypothetical protein n=1 Tax=Nisaea sediminum TaxID=2775867 RepID=UPI0018692749|nr:hypothetical protein [Nisaea sediminum]
MSTESLLAFLLRRALTKLHPAMKGSPPVERGFVWKAQYAVGDPKPIWAKYPLGARPAVRPGSGEVRDVSKADEILQELRAVRRDINGLRGEYGAQRKLIRGGSRG